MDARAPICFQCGQPAEASGGRLNRLDDGRPCPTCSERLMASLRPLLPGWSEGESQEPGTAEGGRSPRRLGRYDAADPGPDAEPA